MSRFSKLRAGGGGQPNNFFFSPNTECYSVSLSINYFTKEHKLEQGGLVYHARTWTLKMYPMQVFTPVQKRHPKQVFWGHSCTLTIKYFPILGILIP